MNPHSLESTAISWISLWSVPVDWALFDAIHADAFEDCASAGREATKAGFASGLKALTDAFPDLETAVDDLVVDTASSKVAVRWTSRGTNAKAFLGTGPTGKPTVIRGIEIIHVHDGKIVRRWGEWDISGHTGS